MPTATQLAVTGLNVSDAAATRMCWVHPQPRRLGPDAARPGLDHNELCALLMAVELSPPSMG
jgi:hypothetical protein